MPLRNMMVLMGCLNIQYAIILASTLITVGVSILLQIALIIYEKINNMEHLVILDFNSGDVDIYPIEYTQEPDMDDLLDSLGHNANDCQWMFSQGNITFHKEVLK